MRQRFLLYAFNLFLLVPLSSHGVQYHFVDVNAHPLGYYDEAGKVDGVAVELFTTVMRNLGHLVTIELMPGNRVLHMLKEGRADGVPFIRKTSERQAFLDYCETPLLTENLFFYSRGSQPFDFNGDLAQLQGVEIATILGDSHGEAFTEMKNTLSIIEVNSIEASFSMLLKNRVDVVLSTDLRAEKPLSEMKFYNIHRSSHPLDSLPLYVAFSKARKLEALRDDFDRELKRLRQSGQTEAILKRWLSQ